MKQRLLISQCTESKQAQELYSSINQGLVTLKISPANQELTVFGGDVVLHRYPISTAANGLGEEKNSYKTPRGWHVIRAKIGASYPENAVFVNRRFTGEIYGPDLNQQFPNRDWILTRIMWLSGLEPGKNRLGNVDTMQRYVYIHGTPDDRPVGKPTSRGCIRMLNKDIIELFNLVAYGTKVFIEDEICT